MALQFLDLHDLNDNDKTNLMRILNPDNKFIKLPWDTLDSNNSNNDSVPITKVQNVEQRGWYNVIPTYPGQVITQMCNNWQTMYNLPPNTHVQFLPGMTYTYTTGYSNLGTEIQNVNYDIENEHHQNRNRSNVNRNNVTLNSIDEMQSRYMSEYSQMPIVYYAYADQHPIASTQHPQVAPEQIYYAQQIYPSIPHPHPNVHMISSFHTHPEHQQPPSIPLHNTFMQSVPSQQVNPKLVEQQIVESNSKQENTSTSNEPAHQQVNNSEVSVQSKVTISVTNSIQQKSDVEDTNKNTAIRKNITNDEKVNEKMQSNIVQNINENGVEKIEKNIEDKITPNNRTTAMKNSLEKSVHNKTNKKVQFEESVLLINAEDKTVINTPNGFSVTNSSLDMPNASSSTSETSIPKKSYASFFKKDTSHEVSCNTKSSACTNKVTVIKNKKSIEEQKINNTTVEKQNGLSSTLNGVVQNYYDPNILSLAEFLSSYQINKNTISLVPRGLTNRNNYCYVNSILQALLACPPFYNLFMSIPKDWKNSLTPLIVSMTRFVREFAPMAKTALLSRKNRMNKDKMKESNNRQIDIHSDVAFEPSYAYTMLKSTSAIFSQDEQQDAEEFLSCLLNGINDEMLELIRLLNNEGVKNNVSNNCNEKEAGWQVMGPKNKGIATRSVDFGRTPLSDIFRGQLRSRISRTGEQPSDNIQPFFTLQLDVHKADSVRSAFELLVGKDQLEGMRCSKTRKQIEAWKQVMLEELPIILILHLKWFVYKYDRYSDGCSKILKTMEFPVDLKLDEKFLTPTTMKKLSPKQKQYKLFAVTYHDGKETTKGHYTTDAFHVGYGSWIRYDDSSVECVSESNVLKPVSPRVPYLLYYRRCDTIGNNH